MVTASAEPTGQNTGFSSPLADWMEIAGPWN
jgi:hypothetical protein